jgi:predicted enzyme related to lactoylglutathione lyase
MSSAERNARLVSRLRYTGTNNSMKLKHVYLTSADPERLSEFYTNVGFDIRFSDPGRWIQFKTEGAAFCIASQEESTASAPANAIAVFEVTDLEAALATAGKAGALRIGEVREMGAHGRVGWIEDPDHNIVQFFESLPRDTQIK